MNTLLTALALFFSAHTVSASDTTSELQIAVTDSGWIRVQGAKALALYDALKVTEKTSHGEAGDNIIFKFGYSYTCWHDINIKSTDAYVCTISIKDAANGIIK